MEVWDLRKSWSLQIDLAIDYPKAFKLAKVLQITNQMTFPQIKIATLFSLTNFH